MRFTLFTCIFFLTLSVTAKENFTKDDTAKINSILRTVDVLKNVNRDSAILLTEQAYSRARAVEYSKGIADAAYLLGTNEMHLSNYEKALFYYQQSIKHYKEIGDLRDLAEVYQVAGINEGMQNNSAKALSWFLQAKNIIQQLKDDHELAQIDYKIGLVYGQVNDFKNAVAYQEKSLAYAKKTNDQELLGAVYNNLGMTYGRMKEYSKALTNLQEARKISEKNNLISNLADVFLNFGNVYCEIGKYDSSRYYLESSYNIYKQANFPIGVAGTSTALGNLLIHQHQYDQALQYIRTSLDLAASFDDKDLLFQNHLHLQQAYKAQGKYKEAAMLSDTIMALSQLVQGAEKRALVEKASMENEVRNMEASIKDLEEKNQASAWQRNVLLVIIFLTVLFVIVAVVAFMTIRKTNRLLTKQKENLENLNLVKDRLFAVISHDLRSPLGSIIGSLELVESGMLNEAEQKALLGELYLSTSATLETLDNMLQWGTSQFNNRELFAEAVDIKLLAEKTGKLFGNVAAHKSIRLVQNIDEACVARFDKNQLEFIMRNLVANAIKFSHEGKQVELRGYHENGHVILEVEDQGVGIPESTKSRLFDTQNRVSTRGTSGERGIGLGLVLIHEFVEKNNGKISVFSKEGVGSCFKLYIPSAS